MTNRIEGEARDYFRKIEQLGGVIPAIKAGFFQREIAEAAYRYQREIDQQRRIIVGVNEYVEDEPLTVPLLRMDPAGERRQIDRLRRLRDTRDNETVRATLAALREAAKGTDNLMPCILDAVRAYATLQEITDVFRDVFGVYQEPDII
jgi:methylmalonyl-CoA mutase N-terminal domain/subunit